jgi:urea transporter
MRHRLAHVFAAACRHILQTVLRVLVTVLVSAVCLMVMLRYLGVPVPGPVQLLKSVEGLSELAKVLS